MFSIFGAKEDVVSRVKGVQEEVVIIKQACKCAVKAFKDNMQLKRHENRESMARESVLFKSGELMLSKADQVKQEDSPIKQVLSKTGEVFQTMGKQQANLETTIHHILEEGKINKASQDYIQAESEMADLKRKIALYNNGKNKFEKEQKKLELVRETNDTEFENDMETRANRAEVSMDLAA